jgi:hypothetical protein
VNKQNWPEFPLWWLDESKRNMSGLEEIASHLKQKTDDFSRSRSGVTGTASEIEKQLTEHVSILRQQVSILTDVTQALLQIIAEDHEQRSTRTKRAFRWIRETWKRFWLAIEQNMAYRITAVIGTIVGTVAALWGLIRYFHLFGQ